MFQKFMKMMNKKNKGFTLVELMVVVVIIGILVAIAIPVYNSVTKSAAEKACFANQRTIEGAAQQWVAGASGRTIAGTNGAVDASSVLLNATEKYLKDVPKCPSQTGGNYSLTNGVITTFPTGCTHGHF